MNRAKLIFDNFSRGVLRPFRRHQAASSTPEFSFCKLTSPTKTPGLWGICESSSTLSCPNESISRLAFWPSESHVTPVDEEYESEGEEEVTSRRMDVPLVKIVAADYFFRLELLGASILDSDLLEEVGGEPDLNAGQYLLPANNSNSDNLNDTAAAASFAGEAQPLTAIPTPGLFSSVVINTAVMYSYYDDTEAEIQEEEETDTQQETNQPKLWVYRSVATICDIEMFGETTPELVDWTEKRKIRVPKKNMRAVYLPKLESIPEGDEEKVIKQEAALQVELTGVWGVVTHPVLMDTVCWSAALAIYAHGRLTGRF